MSVVWFEVVNGALVYFHSMNVCGACGRMSKWSNNKLSKYAICQKCNKFQELVYILIGFLIEFIVAVIIE